MRLKLFLTAIFAVGAAYFATSLWNPVHAMSPVGPSAAGKLQTLSPVETVNHRRRWGRSYTRYPRYRWYGYRPRYYYYNGYYDSPPYAYRPYAYPYYYGYYGPRYYRPRFGVRIGF